MRYKKDQTTALHVTDILTTQTNSVHSFSVPYGVFIGCQDIDVCKKFAASACMVRWVRETCKSKCGQCGYREYKKGKENKRK